jgi:hypothetical protein
MLALPKLRLLIPEFRSQDRTQAIASETGAVAQTKGQSGPHHTVTSYILHPSQ